MPACGCSGARRALAQLSSSSDASSPGSTTAPFGSEAMTLSSRAVAGTVPVDPAAITGCGEPVASRSVSSAINAVAPRDGRDEALVGEIFGPMLGDDLEELDGELPVAGEFLGHDGRRAGRDRSPPFRSRPSDWRGRRQDKRPVPGSRRRPGQAVTPRSAAASRRSRCPKASTSCINASRRGSAPIAGCAERAVRPRDRPRPRR